MIDPNTGELVLDAGKSIVRSLDEKTFVISPLGASARAGLSHASYQWYHLRVEIDGSPWALALGFHAGSIEFASLALVSGMTSWAEWDRTTVEKEALELRSLLQRWLKRPPTEQTPLVEKYVFHWGSVSAGLAPQDSSASIAIHYRQ